MNALIEFYSCKKNMFLFLLGFLCILESVEFVAFCIIALLFCFCITALLFCCHIVLNGRGNKNFTQTEQKYEANSSQGKVDQDL